MNCRVEKSEINGKIICPPNKSYTHRAIFLASLAIDKSIIKKSPIICQIINSRGFNDWVARATKEIIALIIR